MDDIPEVYYLETIEQMRAISDELRQRIIEILGRQPMTVKQLGLYLGQAPAKMHYHVHELERVGLLKQVETREKRGILEKYFRAVAKNLSVSEGLLQRTSPDETIASVSAMLQNASRSFITALAIMLRKQSFEREDFPALNGAQVWVTDEEYLQLLKQINALVEPFRAPRGREGERERTFVSMAYLPVPGSQDEASPAASAFAAAQERAAPRASASSTPASKPHERIIGIGLTIYSRKDLERSAKKGKKIDIDFVGYCRFASDVTPELIEQAIGHFRFLGKLDASTEVRAALKRKEVQITIENP
ncbi:MAG TPA: helix-turn-helix domain-containing protein [Ktedonobacteraceae bacterium]|jgi:DNA-binding transcriptional ArsR family regulator